MTFLSFQRRFPIVYTMFLAGDIELTLEVATELQSNRKLVDFGPQILLERIPEKSLRSVL